MGILLVIYAIWGPTVMAMLKCWFINPMNTLGISIIKHNYWSYKPTLPSRGGHFMGIRPLNNGIYGDLRIKHDD
jgi:hypothetical protein